MNQENTKQNLKSKSNVPPLGVRGLPLVSIVIPTYNRAHLIGETLDSVLAQTYANWKCIIVDDGSNDNTDEVVGEYVKKDARFIYLKRPDYLPKGGNGARNYGLSSVKSPYFSLLDSDDLLHKNKLSAQIDLFHKNEDADMIVCKSQFFEKNIHHLKRLHQRSNKSCGNVLQDYLSGEYNWCINAPLIKTDAINGLKFNLSLYKSQEWLFFSECLVKKPKLVFQNEVLVYIRKHKSRIGSKKDIKYLESSIESRKIIYHKLKKYNDPYFTEATPFLLRDFNGFFKSASKRGAFKVCRNILKFLPKNVVSYPKAMLAFIMLSIFKRGVSLNVITY